jgi:hypothetical protein
MLSSMNMPDGIQRRRTSVDELNMRNIFVEHDVVCVSPVISNVPIFTYLNSYVNLTKRVPSLVCSNS